MDVRVKQAGDDTVHSRGCVLVAEGDEAIRGRIVKALMSAGIMSVEARTQQIALTYLWTDPTIDLILADRWLPGGSGTRLIDAAHAGLCRDFEAIILAPNGSVPGYRAVDWEDTGAVVRAAAESLRDVAERRMTSGEGDVVPSSTTETSAGALFECLAVAAGYKDDETGWHNRRIGRYARTMAAALGWSEERQMILDMAAKMHDIGKIGIPEQILLKPGKLTDDERNVMQRHTLIGHDILSAASSPVLGGAAAIALHHHERWSGDGYPYGLKEEAIPVEARMTALCDVYDALRSARPYKAALAHKEAMKIILSGDNRTQTCHFDPDLLVVFESIGDRFQSIFETMTGN